MDIFKIFDAYSLRARLFPAVIAAAPALAALALFVSWKSFGLSNAIATLAAAVLLFAIADIARRRGKAVERRAFPGGAGLPSITLFRRSDEMIDEATKQRYRSFLAHELGVDPPSAEDEAQDQESADKFYEQCGIWLRQATRDAKKFPILFNENATYGFRRNLLGVKWFALILNILVVVFCVGILSLNKWGWDTSPGKRTIVVLLIATAHAAYMLLAVRWEVVLDAATTYGRELILSCQAFVSRKTRLKAGSPSAGDRD